MNKVDIKHIICNILVVIFFQKILVSTHDFSCDFKEKSLKSVWIVHLQTYLGSFLLTPPVLSFAHHLLYSF